MGFEQDRLAALEADFKAAKEPQKGGGSWMPDEDGDYQVIVERFDTFTSKDKSRLFLKAELKIANDREHDGQVMEKVWELDNPERMGYLKADLRTMGLSPDDDDFSFGNLLNELEQVLDVPLMVAVVTSNRVNEKTGENYRNIYLNQRLGAPLRRNDVERTGKSDVPATVPPTADDDDGDPIPF
jgi:hypothetical protein